MNTNIETKRSTTTVGPSKLTIGVWGWLRKNLFSNWYNTIFSILSAILLLYIIHGTFAWIFTNAEWAVVSDNFKLFMVGQYPVNQLWRIWVALAFIGLLFGLSSGIWKSTVLHLTVVLNILLAIHIFVPYTTMNTKLWLIVCIVISIVGYVTSTFTLRKKITVIIGWLLSFPIILFLVNGFGVLTEVRTNVWGGLLLTLLLSIVAIAFPFPIGIFLALGRYSKLPIIKYFSICYIEAVRGVPLITVFFMSQLMVPLFLPQGITINNVLSAMIGATLFTAAYMAENVRGGLQSIPKGQFEAAKAIGLNAVQSMTFIIMPQALRAVIPAIVGQSISMFKDTSLVAIVGLIDLLGIAQSVKANPDYLGSIMEVYLFIALIYWIIAYSMSYASRRLEKTLAVGER